MNKEEIDKILNEKIIEFIEKYRDKPNYIKIPLWVINEIKRNMPKTDFKLDYEKGLITYDGLYDGLIVCETITISEISEIEVF